MSDALAVAVNCYAGTRGDETPRRFTRGDQLVEILAVVDQWRTPDHRYFKVRTADETRTLRQDVQVTEVGRSDPRCQMIACDRPRPDPAALSNRVTRNALRSSRSRVLRVLGLCTCLCTQAIVQTERE